jgi:sugar/nucleoside kinase (ribokinase family)
MKSHYNLIILGHLGYDHVYKPGVETHNPGGAVFYSSMAVARLCQGKHVGVVTKVGQRDLHLPKLLEARGLDVHVIPVPETHALKVFYPSEDVGERSLEQVGFAGAYQSQDLPQDLEADLVYLAMNTHLEADLDFIRSLKRFDLAVDMQAFIRRVDANGVIHYEDVPDKKAIVSAMRIVKLDDKEGEMLTGLTDPIAAAREVLDWGCEEVVMTCTKGTEQLAHVVRADGIFTCPFTNCSNEGRNGRGDTTFGSYLLRRLDHSPEESLKFGCAVASMKMENPGPNNEFNGTLEQVLERLETA